MAGCYVVGAPGHVPVAGRRRRADCVGVGVLLSRHDQLDPALYARVVHAREAIELDPAALARVDERRRALLRYLEGGGTAYGVTTGLGYLTTRPVEPGEREGFQRSILVGRASGVGPPLPENVVRGAMLVRLAGFLSGLPGVSAGLCRFLADRLNDGWSPVVPRAPLGTAGETIPLSHLFQTFIGEGAVREGGAVVGAGEALARRSAAPYALGVKEGLALVAGAPFAAALGEAAERRAGALLAHADLHLALAVALVGVPRRPYSARVGRLREEPGQQHTHAALARLLGAGKWADALQAPVSFRVAPQVHGAARDALGRLHEQVARELRAVTDGPVFLDAGEGEPEGLYPTGAFHAQALTLDLDALAVALTQVTNLLEKRLHRLLDGRFSRLPEQLAADPGRASGLVTLHKAVVGLCAESRLLAAPASVHAADTSSGQEDFQAFTFLAAGKLDRVMDALELALAYELVALRQARHLRGAPLGAPLEGAMEVVASAVEPFGEDRSAAPDVERARELVRSGAVLRAASP
jgi:histidine ammonia-lyase